MGIFFNQSYITMKRIFLILTALISVSLVWAEASFDFSESMPDGWTSSSSSQPKGYETTGDSRGTQFDGSTTLSFPAVENVREVTILYSSNTENDNENSIEVQVDGVSYGIKKLPKKTKNQELVFTHDTGKSGEMKIIITRTKKSVWIKRVTIDGSYDPAIIPGEDPMEGLNMDYIYTEPTEVISTDSLGSKIEYSFIHNNVKVSCNYGTKTQTYFGPLAGQKITFITTRKMKAVVVDGFVRKGFSASSSSGTIAYKSSDAVDLEEEQILAVTDIDSTALSVKCDAQLRCYKVYVYFESNPDIDIQPEEETYSYDDETTEVTTMDITFTDVEAEDMTESLGYPFTDLYLSNDEYDIELWVFASTVESTILPPGIYPIQAQPEDSYTPNTVMASLGGYEDYDYPSYLITDFVHDEVNDIWTYNKVYYLVSGTLEVIAAEEEDGVQMNIHATTYNGSTVNASYMRNDEAGDAVENTTISVKAVKIMRDGHLLIQRNGVTYGIEGQRR